MQFYCCCPFDTETSQLREELFSMKAIKINTPTSASIGTTSTASSIYASSVSMCPNYKHCQLYLHI